MLDSLKDKGSKIIEQVKNKTQRLGYLKDAAKESGKYNLKNLKGRLKEDGLALLSGLGAILLVSALAIAIPTLILTIAGAIFGAGVGAAAGAVLGVQIGMAILEVIGMVAVSAYIVSTVKEAGSHYWKYLQLAWNSGGDKKKLDKASRECSKGNSVLLAGLLEGVATYGVIRGVSKAFSSLKKSRFVRWIGEERLRGWVKRRIERRKGEPIDTEIGRNTFNPLRKGPLPANIVQTFRSGTYRQVVSDGNTILYRVYGGNAGKFGPFWTKTPPSGPLQSMIDYALNPKWGNKATNIVKIKIPKGIVYYEGYAGPESGIVGGGKQVYFLNIRIKSNWIIK